MPEYNLEFGITDSINPKAVKKAFEDNSDAVGLFVTCPTYYGICSDLEELEQIVHANNKLLLVDEAHGSHLSFNDRLPKSAMQLNADICIQSAHKTLPAVTQAAYLHVKGNRIDLDKLQYNLSILLTSSPSYIIMSSLDIARAIMETNGNKLLDDLLDIIIDVKKELGKILNVKILDKSSQPSGRFDYTRLVINLSKIGITGYKLEQLLRENHGIQAEMSDIFNTVFISTVSDDINDFSKLVKAIKIINNSYNNSNNKNEVLAKIKFPNFGVPKFGIDLFQSVNCRMQKVVITKAVGRISGHMIVPYPPGIPIICPGEIFSQEIVDYLFMIKNFGGNFQGVDENMNVNILYDS